METSLLGRNETDMLCIGIFLKLIGEYLSGHRMVYKYVGIARTIPYEMCHV